MAESETLTLRLQFEGKSKDFVMAKHELVEALVLKAQKYYGIPLGDVELVCEGKKNKIFREKHTFTGWTL